MSHARWLCGTPLVGLILALSNVATIPAGAEERIALTLLDSARQPLSDVRVCFAPPRSQPVDREELDIVPSLEEVRSNAEGVASIAVPQALAERQLKGVWAFMAWKPGYELQIGTVQANGTTVLAKTMDAVYCVRDEANQPLVGRQLSLTKVAFEVGAFQIPEAWRNMLAANTDRAGIVRLPQVAKNLTVIVEMAQADGVPFCFRLFSTAKSSINMLRSAATGQIEGQIDPQVVQRYNWRISPMRLETAFKTAYSDAQIVPKEDGSFRLDNVVAGDYWLRCHAKSVSIDDTLEHVVGPMAVRVTAGKATGVRVTPQPATVVTGRITGGSSDLDYSTLQVQFSLRVESDRRLPGAAVMTYQTVAQTVACNADGTYTARLLPGQYLLRTVYHPNWISPMSRANATLTIGNGAASVQAPDLKIAPTQTVQVHCPPEIYSIVYAGIDDPVALTITSDAGSYHSVLSVDGYGTVQLPQKLSVQRLTLVRPRNLLARMLVMDRDPSTDITVGLIQPPDKARNHVVKVRVVDGNGQPLKNVPVELTVSADRTRKVGNTEIDLQGSAITSVYLTDEGGVVRTIPTQLMSPISPSLPQQSLAMLTGISVRARVLLTATSAKLERSMPASDQAWKLDDEIDLGEMVVKAAPVSGNLAIKAVNPDAATRAGLDLWLFDGGRTRRGVTDEQGNFDFGPLTGNGWLFTLSDLGIRRVTASEQPLELDLSPGRATHETSGTAVRQRSTLEQRRESALPLIEALIEFDKKDGKSEIELPVESFLEPERYFTTLTNPSEQSDLLRYQWVSFWTGLSDEQLEELIRVTEDVRTRVVMLALLAERHQTIEAWQRVWDALDERAFAPSILGKMEMVDLLSEVAIKLYHHRQLNDRLSKLSQTVALFDKATERIRQNPTIGENYTEPTSIVLCRALLDPEEFVDRIEEFQFAKEENSRTRVMSDMRRYQSQGIWVRLHPDALPNFQIGELMGNDAMWRQLGQQMPSETLAYAIDQSARYDVLWCLSGGALEVKHPDALPVFDKTCQSLRENSFAIPIVINYTDTNSYRALSAFWSRAASEYSPETGRKANWHLAIAHLLRLNTAGTINSNSISTMVSRLNAPLQSEQTAILAGCLEKDYPDLANQLADQALEQLEQSKFSFKQSFLLTGRIDLSWLAYFDADRVDKVLDAAQAALTEKEVGDARTVRSIIQARLSSIRGRLLDSSGLMQPKPR